MADEEEPKEGPTEDPREPKPKEGATDYTKPTDDKRKKTAAKTAAQVDKKIKKVVSGEVKVQKRGIGTKVKNLFVAADLKSVVAYVAYDILLPAAKGMIVDGAARGVERFIYGDIRPGRRGGMPGERSRITYGGIVDRGRDDRDPRTRPPSNLERSRYPRSGQNDYIFATRQDAEETLDEMLRILEICDVVSVADFNEIIGVRGPFTDQKYGWEDLRGTEIRDVRKGWMIELPPPEPI